MNSEDAKTYWRTLIRDEPETALAIAKECPPIAGGWSTYTHGDYVVWVRDIHDDETAEVLTGKTFYAAVGSIDLGRFPTLTEAKSACDAKLRELGYLLEDE